MNHAEYIMILCNAFNHRPYPKVSVREVRAGRANHKKNMIVLPAWLAKKPETYQRYYCAHELAHIMVGVHGHGMVFQAKLHELNAADHYHEAGYKPKLYKQFMESLA